jgi:hypothetical protein
MRSCTSRGGCVTNRPFTAVVVHPGEIVGRVTDGARSYLAIVYVIESQFLDSVG